MRNISSIDDLELAAQEFIGTLSGRDLVLLEGPMGVGKTTWTQTVCRRLGVGEAVTSPTYALHHQYEAKELTYPIHHIDLYRLGEQGEEVISTGILDIFEDELGLVIVEWGLREEWRPSRWRVHELVFSFDPQGERWIKGF